MKPLERLTYRITFRTGIIALSAITCLAPCLCNDSVSYFSPSSLWLVTKLKKLYDVFENVKVLHSF